MLSTCLLTDASVTAADRDAVAALLSEVFDPHPEQRAMMDAWALDPTRRVLLARMDDVWVGILVARLLPSDQLDRYGPPFGVDLVERLGEGLVAALQVLAVRPGYRKRGVGRSMASAMTASLRAEGALAAVGVSWDHGRGEGSRGMFEAGGFEVAAESRTFYARVNEESGKDCRYCRPEPCSCNAVLFVRAPL